MARQEISVMSSLQQPEHQHDRERLALTRDRRVARLEGQRLLLSALLATLVVGWVLIHVAVVRPGSNRQALMIAELTRSGMERQTDNDRERERRERRVKDLEFDVAQLDSQLSLAQKRLPEREAQQQRRPIAQPKAGARRELNPALCTDDNDPLCGTLKSK